MRALVILDDAVDDLKEIARYVALQEQDKGRGAAFAKRLRTKCAEVAAASALQGRSRPEFGHDLRSTPFLNYLIFFRYSGDRLEVVVIIHSARDLTAAFNERKTSDEP